jgi:hypothetical protein
MFSELILTSLLGCKEIVGTVLGLLVGLFDVEGDSVGFDEALIDNDGFVDGWALGKEVGDDVGNEEGDCEGTFVGKPDGPGVGL